ncbi:hypothetical protein FACS1894154_12420 [Betaproteobacteria bacterium]|nr:hypothetical protein FACS1894154_12420 [Betaproteobacteria bacterium]
MQSNTISQYLNLVNLQIAAEAFLVVEETGVLKENLFDALVEGNKHASVFTKTDATDFLNNFEIIAQKPNTSTGFSGTLFKALKDDPQSGLKAGQYFLSFRSTEFVDDCIRDSEGTNESIRHNGWAFGQICDMEDWYQELKNDLPANVDLTVIGYSLGGHLATAFRQLRLEANEPDIATYSINGAGTGKIKNGYTLTDALEVFREVWTTGQIPVFAPQLDFPENVEAS